MITKNLAGSGQLISIIQFVVTAVAPVPTIKAGNSRVESISIERDGSTGITYIIVRIFYHPRLLPLPVLLLNQIRKRSRISSPFSSVTASYFSSSFFLSFSLSFFVSKSIQLLHRGSEEMWTRRKRQPKHVPIRMGVEEIAKSN